MSKHVQQKVMVAGHLCIDITPRFPSGVDYQLDKMFSPGVLTTIAEPVFSTGGPVSNTGLAMDKLGMDVALNGKVGDDAFAGIIKELIGPEKAMSLKVVPGQNTSYTIVFAVPGVDRFVMHNPGTNDTFGPEDIDYDAAKNCRLFHFGYPPLMKRMYENNGAELARIYSKVKGLGVTTSLDMAMPDPKGSGGMADWIEILKRVLPYVDIFVPSIEEITFMLNRDLFDRKKARSAGADPVLAYDAEDCAQIANRLHSMGVKIVVIKCGIRGVYLHTLGKEAIADIGPAPPEDITAWSNREIWAASFKTEKFASALGAGDATIAGFLCGLVRGFPPQQALSIANTVGWQNVQAVDALSGISDWKTVLELIKNKNRPQNDTNLDESKWQYCTEYEVYYGPQDKKD
jgi:sugar/nucleoside kinase (ribokinase family)